MSLKARTGLIVFCFVAVIVAGLVLAGQLREALLRDQLSQTATAGSSALWSKIVEAGVQRMRGRTSIVERRSLPSQRPAEWGPGTHRDGGARCAPGVAGYR